MVIMMTNLVRLSFRRVLPSGDWSVNEGPIRRRYGFPFRRRDVRDSIQLPRWRNTVIFTK